MTETLKELEKLCYQSIEMSHLLGALSKGAELMETWDDMKKLQENLEEIAQALSITSKMQYLIGDKIWDIFYELEKIENNK